MSYQDTIIPETDQMYSTISQQLGLIDEGIYIKADFSHIPVLQDDKNQQSSTVVSLVQNGVIDPNEARNVLGYSEREEQERSIQALNGAQVTSMVQVAESVATGMLSPLSAIEILIISFGISRDQAESIVNNIGSSPINP